MTSIDLNSMTAMNLDGLPTKIAVNDLNVWYGKFHALKHITLAIPEGRVTAFIGPSGCGKSTLAGGIAGLVKPASGTISVNGRVFRSDDPCIDLPVESRGIGFVFQSHRLFPHLTVRENLLFGRRFGGRRTAVDQDRLIEVLGIAHLLSRRPDTLSGGESQRVALGRAILAAETLLIMDEPLASLDLSLIHI